MRSFFLFLFLISFSSMAQVPTTPENTCPPCQVCPTCPQPPITSATHRGNSFGTFLIGTQYVNTWVGNKIAGSYTQIFNRNWSMEAEYATSQDEKKIAGYSLGTMREDRYSLLVKYYIGTSFHISVGPYYTDLSFKLNQNRITDALGDRIGEKFRIAGYGAALGIGNRWQFRNGITFGFDWIRINQPLGEIQVKDRILNRLDGEDRDDVKRTGRIFRTIPAFTVFAFNLGYTF